MSEKKKEVIRIEMNFPSILSTRFQAAGLEVYGDQSREAAAERHDLADALRRMSDTTDRFNLRQSAPAVFHLYKAARVYTPLLKRRSRQVTKEDVVGFIAGYGPPFAGEVPGRAFHYIDPYHRFGRGDPDYAGFDAATLSDTAFRVQYMRDEFVGEALALVIFTTHWFITRRLVHVAEGGKNLDELHQDLLIALKQHGFSGDSELKALVKIISWMPSVRQRKKTPSIKKPGPERPLRDGDPG